VSRGNTGSRIFVRWNCPKECHHESPTTKQKKLIQALQLESIFLIARLLRPKER
jgi:hypothetical protein